MRASCFVAGKLRSRRSDGKRRKSDASRRRPTARQPRRSPSSSKRRLRRTPKREQRDVIQQNTLCTVCMWFFCVCSQQQLEQERLDRELALRLAAEDTSQVEEVQREPLNRCVLSPNTAHHLCSVCCVLAGRPSRAGSSCRRTTSTNWTVAFATSGVSSNLHPVPLPTPPLQLQITRPISRFSA